MTSLLKEGKHEIAALSRSEDKANKLKELGVRPVMGSLDDEILVEESAKADVSKLSQFSSFRILESDSNLFSLKPADLLLRCDRSLFMPLLPTINLPSNPSSKDSLSDQRTNLPRSTFTLPAVRFLYIVQLTVDDDDLTSFDSYTAGILTVPLHPESIYFSDENPQQFDNLVPDHAPHRDVDLLIKTAVEKGDLNAKVSIMLRKF